MSTSGQRECGIEISALTYTQYELTRLDCVAKDWEDVHSQCIGEYPLGFVDFDNAFMFPAQPANRTTVGLVELAGEGTS